jgi:hypothetical protein
MIQITCTSCKRVLTIDDAFAGGVCRCQHCGTIQTVPARGSTQKAAAGAAKGPKTLFENKARPPGGIGSGSGLEDLADVIQSSSGLSDPNLRRSPPAAIPPAKNLTPMLGLAAAVILILLIVVLVMIFKGSGSAQSVANTGGTGNATPSNSASPAAAPVPSTPNFCGIPIDQPVVVYLIDNGASSADNFDAMKLVLFKSIESLGPDRRFQILFWNPDTESYPSGQTTFAVKENIDIGRKKLADVTAAGSTDPLPGLKTAFTADPGQIILVTAKAGDLDDSLPDKVMALRGSSTARIDCIAINAVAGDNVLSKIATKTAGKFLPLSDAQLKAFAF